MNSGGSRIWPREGPTCQRGPQASNCDRPPRDLRAIEGQLRLQTLSGFIMSSEGPFGLLRGPLQTLRGSLYKLRGSLRRSVNPFRGHQNTCWSLQIIPSGTLRVPSGAETVSSRLKGGAMTPWPPSGSATGYEALCREDTLCREVSPL